MRNRDLDRLLHAVHREEPRRDDPARDALRQDLVGRHRRAHPRNRRWKIMTHRIWFRPALAVLALAALGVAACSTPTEYDVAMGQQVTVAVAGSAKDGGTAVIDQVASWLEGRPGVEGVWVGIEEKDGGPTTGKLTVWGQSLDGAALKADLAAAFPDLDDAAVAVQPLEGTVEGTVADALGHAVFGIEVSGDTAEEVRAAILAQLAEQGFTGDAQVEVIDGDDGQRTVNIDLDDVRTGDGQAVIELKKDD